MTTNQVLFGLGLLLVLAVGSQLLARRLGLPAIVVLLPAGFVAGIATDDIHPENLLGQLYQPFVSLAVGVILFEAGLRLWFHELAVGIHRVVERLVTFGALFTWLAIALTVWLLFSGLTRGVALLVGAILVVSGPTVVLPLLTFIHPKREVRAVLKWEGVLIDPIGAIVAVLVFQFVNTGSAHHGWRPGEFFGSIAVGALVGITGAGVLYTLLREVHRNQPRMAVLATLMVVIAAVVVADLIRDDSGFVAATLMGVALANQGRLHPSRRIDISLTQQFHETLVQLLIGVLFVLISASVSPHDVKTVLPQALGLVAVMVLLVRPSAVALATWRSAFAWQERGFLAWMAPRGIVAGATASAFGLQLEQKGVAGAESVLPIVFVVIFCTVVLYGLTAPVVARWLGVAGQERELLLVVGGHDWARQLASALQRAGVSVRMWAGPTADREAAETAGLDAGHGRLMVDEVNREEALEDVSDALLLTRSDDFNAIAAARLRSELGHDHVYRVAPDPEGPDLLPPSSETGILGNAALTFAELGRRFVSGTHIVARQLDEVGLHPAAGDVPLFAVSPEGRLRVAVDGRGLDARRGDTVLSLATPP